MPKPGEKRKRGDPEDDVPTAKRMKFLPYDRWITGTGTSGDLQMKLISKFAGGKKTTCELAVKDFLDIKTNAVASMPKGIAEARLKHPGKKFKAGHLLNACFGGPGNIAANLTILSAAGNKAHGAFDNRIKDAFLHLQNAYRQLAETGLNPAEATLRIKIIVAVSKDKWSVDETDVPDCYICNTLICKAMLLDADAVDRALQAHLASLPDRSGVEKHVEEYYRQVMEAQALVNQVKSKVIKNP